MRVDIERDFWNRVAQTKDLRHNFIVSKDFKDSDFIDILKPLLSGRVLEIGCGIGRLAELYDCGIDISKEMLKKAPKGKGHKVCDGQSIPYPDKSFDSIFSVQVFQHIPDIQPYIDEAYRVLKPGGRFIFQFVRGASKDGPMSFKHLPRLNGWKDYKEFSGIHKDWSWVSVVK